jgi:nitrite reductase/ring-hydroxylating ferredoxin subunit
VIPISNLQPPELPADASAQGLLVCRSEELTERGTAVLWDLLLYRQPARAFVLRVDGAVVAYINRCAHVPTEMDWQAGEFWDMDKRDILCSIHGASYNPRDGRCVGGPCGKGRLLAVRVEERVDAAAEPGAASQVYWYPSRDIQPLRTDMPTASPAAAPHVAPPPKP